MSRQPLPKTVVVLYLTTQSCLGIPEISRKYPKLQVYTKYQELPDISGYPLPNDFQTDLGRVGCRRKYWVAGRVQVYTRWALLSVFR